ncbi:DegT/DnrJ/EryC1/StrS family aminotransferase [Desulfoplanes formicivorans]|uniref:Pleiotrophic regulatory protein DegT n=1 Tax=Desulfoplanes formicivorans TaxID=1592317 RepID=A0A194AFQ8_9BACT|nr:DegT/DnrJ/EryC1/StrS family aminotransferase [Desulfoplanes formicivorans]GAU07609.1 pleiotrophic regulatory protein DegT [Desulfoplanes formicivorans]
MNIPLLDLKAQYATIKDEIDAAVADVFASQYFINGPKVAELEKAVAAYSQCAHACGVSSGSDALLIALMVEGIGAGDEVITTPYTFFATAGAIARVGATPVFVDIDPVTYNIDPEKIPAAITDRTRAIIPVHLYGQMADMTPILDLVKSVNLQRETKNKKPIHLIEDAAQAIGAEYKGHRAGSLGDYGCFSFFPSKNLGGAGDGGMVTCQDKDKAEKLQIFRSHGSRPKYFHKWIGGNFRLDALQAAVLRVKLNHLDAWTAKRQHNAARYNRLFAASGLEIAFTADVDWASYDRPQVVLPSAVQDRHIYNQYVIRVQNRDGLRAFLKDNGIGNEVYYPVSLHMQECFSYLGYGEGDLPQSEQAAQETVALPVYPELNDAMAEQVIEKVKAFLVEQKI